VTYRVLCGLGLALMIARGADRRLLGVTAAGTYLIYVGLTCIFYYVGLAYANVSEAMLFVLFVGLLDSVLYYSPHAYARMAGGGLNATATGRQEVRSGA
jgi:hypothetical protein